MGYVKNLLLEREYQSNRSNSRGKEDHMGVIEVLTYNGFPRADAINISKQLKETYGCRAIDIARDMTP